MSQNLAQAFDVKALFHGAGGKCMAQSMEVYVGYTDLPEHLFEAVLHGAGFDKTVWGTG